MTAQTTPERKLVFILSAIQFTHILDFVIMMPLGPQFIASYSITAEQFAWLISAYTFAGAIMGLVVARIADRSQRKSLLLSLYGIFTVSTLGCGLVQSYNAFLVARMIAGASGGILNGLLLTIIGDEVPELRRGRAIGAVMSSFSLASIVGVPAGLAVATQWGVRAPFLALSAICALVFVLIWVGLLLKSADKPARDAASVSWTTFARGLSVTFFLMMAGYSVVPFVSTSLVANVGVPPERLFSVYLVAGALSFVSSRFIGRLSDRFGKLRVFVTVGGLSVITTLTITNLPPVSLAFSLVVVSLFICLNSGRVIPALALLTSSVSKEQRGRFMTLNAATQQLASGLGALFAGRFVTLDSTGHLVGFANAGSFSVAALLCAMVMAGWTFQTRRLPRSVWHFS